MYFKEGGPDDRSFAYLFEAYVNDEGGPMIHGVVVRSRHQASSVGKVAVKGFILPFTWQPEPLV
jgi:hypothetical protein